LVVEQAAATWQKLDPLLGRGSAVTGFFAFPKIGNDCVIGVGVEDGANDLGVAAAKRGSEILSGELSPEFSSELNPRGEMQFGGIDEGAVHIPNRGEMLSHQLAPMACSEENERQPLQKT
jgi:hypothetical protein